MVVELIKTLTESKPAVEALDDAKVVVAQDNGVITVAYLHTNKMLSVKLNAQAVQIRIHKASVYVSAKPFLIPITAEDEESEEVLANNLLACRKTGVILYKIDIEEDALVVRSMFDKVGGFAIKEDRIYACNIYSYGFYVLSLDLTEIERVPVQIEPSTRRPWYSNITIIDNTLFLMQEEDRIRWFTLESNIEERGIVEPEFPHQTAFVSLNTAPGRILKIGGHILCVLESGEPVVITFIGGKPIVAVDPKIVFPLMYKEKSAVLHRIKEATEQCVLAMDRYRIIVTDTGMRTVYHGFCLDEVDETLNVTRITAFGKYAVCFAWTYAGKYPLVVLNLTNPREPVIAKIIDCGALSGAIKIDADE